jgi:hypothetical protein
VISRRSITDYGVGSKKCAKIHEWDNGIYRRCDSEARILPPQSSSKNASVAQLVGN